MSHYDLCYRKSITCIDFTSLKLLNMPLSVEACDAELKLLSVMLISFRNEHNAQVMLQRTTPEKAPTQCWGFTPYIEDGCAITVRVGFHT